MKMETRAVTVAVLAMLLAAVSPAQAESDSGNWGRGPGMMGGYGQGYGMGPGMMGGGYGQGYGMGPGMMGGGPGYGMGPGMMGGGYGMGPGMMGYGDYRDLGLSSEQQTRINQIRKETRGKLWALMGGMMDAQDALQDLYDADKQDAAAINKQYKVIDDLRRQMVDIGVDTHNKINAVLTKEQREKLRDRSRGWGPGWSR